MIKQVKFKNVYLEVHGHYEPYDAGDWDNPPSGGYFELEKIMLEDTDVTELLEDYIEEIEVLVMNEINDF